MCVLIRYAFFESLGKISVFKQKCLHFCDFCRHMTIFSSCPNKESKKIKILATLEKSGIVQGILSKYFRLLQKLL